MRLHEQWDKKAANISKRLNHAISNLQSQIDIFSESLASALKSNDAHIDINSFSPLIKRLKISEIVLNSSFGKEAPKILYSTQPPSNANVWRATIYDFWKTQMPQSGVEVTEYGPRVVSLMPVNTNEGLCALEVTVDLSAFLSDFSRAEGVETLFLSPEYSGDLKNPQLMWGNGIAYRILAQSSNNSSKIFLRAPVKDYLGREVRGIIGRSAAAFAVMTLDDVEYRSNILPSVGSGSTLVIWSDYSREASDTLSQMRQDLYLSLILLFIFGSAAIALFLHYRRYIKTAMFSARDALAQANISFQREIQMRQRSEEKLRGYTEEIRQARRNDMSIISSVAHQLKLNASSVLGFADILHGDKNVQKDNESISSILQTAERIFFLAENLSAWSAREVFQRPAEHVAIPLKVLIERVCNALSTEALRKEVTLRQSVEEEMLVAVDPILMEIAIKNIVYNAIKFSPRSSVVEISAQEKINEKNKFIELVISDNGKGMSALVMEKLFESDETKLNRGTEGEESLGLGLIIVKWVCLAHDVKLRVTSQEGEGCRVSLLFAAANPKENAGGAPRRG